ncbi:hypothetical protein A2634_01140 [Candidatus Amesbacteria bacterium RIFCSPHIGHO2_01_FULL_48_32]|uniref:Methenyltetrahydrofolate cyclohydrolase n=1 Tax=Candidatus Amesbacteria bacterium RIFCSPLOWO2_01_FULL_48_25 TaxID=1797259 RepID=A0A1F4ZCJ3_9BACT|nr:MAG: hypothetical protein A2634_01140 [Candidatus Amesbacteria bacterium RIFCSPHIGHO2_01_FULL_48_32]OGD03646.1 MAG: hypothetical protein A2989_03125 [Candidatus Amesbacteria bacterium RIFCSPLOWO2_01_FULL_48_25]HJZ06007.1 bifunctional 5,10-methylenetetrahydrofolate dehydrogenase/5,10-methenyltetrahydrofolate cyclohydrolase [Patescibacteria group bacterium]
MIFDGKKFAGEIEKILRDEVIKLGKRLKLVTIVDPANPASVTYTNLKAAMAARLGVDFEIQKSNNKSQIKSKIQKLNVDSDVDGIMVQMPFPNAKFLIDLIDPRKDIDGLREDSPYKPAVVRAICEILISNFEFLNKSQAPKSKTQICVVGSKGFVGSRLMRELPGAVGMDKGDFDPSVLLRASVIVSATGQAGLIKPDMVKEGVVAIDVGYPKGDFDPEVVKKTAFFTPVPGGVGPVTVVMLFKNLVDAVLLE